jgi:hypothetical protein
VFPVADDLDAVALPRQVVFDDLGDVRLVLDHEDAPTAHSRSSVAAGFPAFRGCILAPRVDEPVNPA